MNQLDVYYRALLECKALTSKDRDITRLGRAMMGSNPELDKITVTRGICEIDEEWVREIEHGLEFIEKAIRQERQFIYSNGEVVPIEKVKTVSKESVVHLEKHSNLFSKVHEGEDMIPDKLYTVERLNDYTVYENRFLYMLLCYLRDFVTLRYNDILDATNKYDGKLIISKELANGKQTLKYKIELEDVRRDDKYLREHNKARDIIDRMDLILKTILSLLSTPLMEYQSKAPMLRPPITKTNVLRMNNDFRGAVNIYDYIISYDKPGYEIKREVNVINPFTDDLAEDIALACQLLTFAVYEYGLGIKNELKEAYNAEEERRRVLEISEHDEKVASMKRKLDNSELSPEEYVVEVEKHMRMLKKANAEIEPLKNEVARLNEDIEGLNAEIQTQKDEIRELNENIISMGEEHIRQIDEINKAHEERILAIMKQNEVEIEALRERCNGELGVLRERIKECDEKYMRDMADVKNRYNEKQAALEELENRYSQLSEQKRFCDARIHAYMYKNSEFTASDDFTDKESFALIEEEYELFKKFFDGEWKKTKKRIRSDHLNVKKLRAEAKNSGNKNATSKAIEEKPEEIKAEETKPEEVKIEETKAEEVRIEETKTEEVKTEASEEVNAIDAEAPVVEENNQDKE